MFAYCILTGSKEKNLIIVPLLQLKMLEDTRAFGELVISIALMYRKFYHTDDHDEMSMIMQLDKIHGDILIGVHSTT